MGRFRFCADLAARGDSETDLPGPLNGWEYLHHMDEKPSKDPGTTEGAREAAERRREQAELAREMDETRRKAAEDARDAANDARSALVEIKDLALRQRVVLERQEKTLAVLEDSIHVSSPATK